MTEIASQLNYLDFILLAVLAASIVASVIRGFTREISGLVALILGVLLGMWFHGSVATFIEEYVAAPQIADFIGFSVIFLGVVIAGGIVGALLSKVLKVTGLSLFDRLAGAGFGLLKGALIGAIIVFAFLAFSPSGPPRAVSTSKVAPYVLWSADVLAALAPQNIKSAVMSNVKSIESIWREHAPAIPAYPVEPRTPKGGSAKNVAKKPAAAH